MKGRSNLAASVTARLLNRAKDQGIDFQILLTAYCFERFLFRLGAAGLRDRFVLKGAMLLQLWTNHPYRATRDLDLLRFGDGSFESIRQDLNSILTAQVPPDGVSFDGTGMAIEAIRAEDEYAGARATLSAQCGTAKISLQIDMGVGDAVWPAPVLRTYPGLLDLPSPEVLVYPLEAVVAEKFEAMVVLGERNSRIKDFFDLHHLATRFEFDRPTLAEAVRRTFQRRQTPFPPTDPVGLTADYWANPSRPAQVRAFPAGPGWLSRRTPAWSSPASCTHSWLRSWTTSAPGKAPPERGPRGDLGNERVTRMAPGRCSWSGRSGRQESELPFPGWVPGDRHLEGS